MTVWRFRRAVALSESRALRILVQAYGKIPVVAPTNWDPLTQEFAPRKA